MTPTIQVRSSNIECTKNSFRSRKDVRRYNMGFITDLQEKIEAMILRKATAEAEKAEIERSQAAIIHEATRLAFIKTFGDPQGEKEKLS